MKSIRNNCFVKIGLILIILGYYIYALYDYGIEINKPISPDASLEDLCTIALSEVRKMKRYDMFDFQVGKIGYFGDKSFNSEQVEVILVSKTPNSKIKFPYNVRVCFNTKTNKLENIYGTIFDDHIEGDYRMDYSNWKSKSSDLLAIYDEHIIKYGKFEENILDISGYYDNTLNRPVWRIREAYGDIDILVDPYTGNEIGHIKHTSNGSNFY